MGRGTILHARMRQRRFPYRCMNSYPVNYCLRPAKMVTERLSGFNAYHFFDIHGIHHGNVIGKHRTLAGNIVHPETIQRQESVRPKLNASDSAIAAPPIPPPTIIALVTLAMVILLFRPGFYLVDFPTRRQ